ncbi:glycosyltransferase family 2 protein [Candidatus Uabimicrobium sp. HlEnr_7]|uniref:glycosyltransferase family 2 protein n=1 Tax=Candidatus Uabimicrobium helgolandensis TaxID=3095367 RepID=UPI003556BA9B
MPKISICIPTYNRQDFLLKAIDSCINQTLRPYEILVGDDSTSNSSKQVISEIQKQVGIEIKYFDHEPSLGQQKNVAYLFSKSCGDYVVLLHDDDELENTALENMVNCFNIEQNIVAVYGKQTFLLEDDTPFDDSVNLNNLFFRNAKYQGPQKNSLKMAILQQFPNDGYMVKSDIIKKIDYANLGGRDAVDFFFALSVSKYGNFYFLDKYTARYRVMKKAISKNANNNAGYMSFQHVYENFSEQDPQIENWLRQKSPVAIVQAVKLRDKNSARRWFFSKYHRHKILTLGGIKRFFMIL